MAIRSVAGLAAAVVALMVGTGGGAAFGQQLPTPHAFVVTGEDRDTIQVVDIGAERVVGTMRLPGHRFTDIEAVSQGDRLVYALDAAGNTIEVIDPAADAVLRSVPVPPGMTRLSTTVFGDLVVVAGGSSAHVVDTASGRVTELDQAEGIVAVAIRTGASTAYLATGGSLEYRSHGADGVTGTQGGLNQVNSVAAQGSRVVVGGRVVSVYSAFEPRKLATVDIGADTLPDGLVFDVDTRVFAAVAGRVVRIDLADESSRTLAEADLTTGIAMLDRRVAGIGADGHLRMIDQSTGEILVDFPIEGAVKGVAFTVTTRSVPPTEPQPSSPAPSEPPTTTTAEPTVSGEPSAPPVPTSTAGGDDPDSGDAGAPGAGGGLATTGRTLVPWAAGGGVLVLIGGLIVLLVRPRLRRS